MDKGKFLAVIVILYGSFQLSEGLQCYVCNSVFNENCGTGKPDGKYLVTCSSKTAKPVDRSIHLDVSATELQEVADNSADELHPWDRNYTMCRKTVDSIPRQNNAVMIREGETRVFRSCGWEGDLINGCKWGAGDGIHRKMCTCSEDKCNSANINFISYHLIIAGILCILKGSFKNWN